MAQGEEAVSSQEEPLREARTITSRPARPHGRPPGGPVRGVRPDRPRERRPAGRHGRPDPTHRRGRGRLGAGAVAPAPPPRGAPSHLARLGARPGRRRRRDLGTVAVQRHGEHLLGHPLRVRVGRRRAVTVERGVGLHVGRRIRPAVRRSVAVRTSSPSAVSPSAVSPSAVSPSTAVSPSVAAATVPMAWGGATVLTPPGLVATGPGVSYPGSDVAYVADADGTSFDVFQRVRLAQPSTRSRSPCSPRPPHWSPSWRACRSRRQAAGRARRPRGHPTRQAHLDRRRAAGAAFSGLVLRYRLTSAVTQIRPTQTGRYSALLTPLLRPACGRAAHHRRASSTCRAPRLRSLTCPLNLPPSAVRPGHTGGLSANLAAGTPPLLQLHSTADAAADGLRVTPPTVSG